MTSFKTITVLAPSLTAARRAVAVRAGFRTGRITDICETESGDQTTDHATATSADGHAALQILLTAEFLELFARPACIADWLRSDTTQAGQAWQDIANAKLSLAGLRIVEGGLAVANNPEFMFLINLFAATKWAGGQWSMALRNIPGARVTNLTFAGIRSRAVIVPLPANPTKRSTSHDSTGKTASGKNLDTVAGNFRTSRRGDFVFSSKRAATDGRRGLPPAIAAQPQPGDVAARPGTGLD